MAESHAGLAKEAADSLLVAPLRDSLIRLGGLSLGLRLLAVLGYILIALLLVAVLLLELLAPNLPTIAWNDSVGSFHIPYLALCLSSGGLVLGWAYLLTGAAAGGRRVFYPLLLFSALDMFWVSPFTLGLLLATCLLVPFLLGVAIAYFFTYQKRFWRAVPLLQVFLVALILTLSLSTFWAINPDANSLVPSLHTTFILLSWVASIFWVASGPALVDMVVKVARWALAGLRRVIPGERLRLVSMLVVLIHPGPALLLFFLLPRGNALRHFSLGDGVLAVLVFLVGLVLLLARRWNARNALTALGISLAAPVFGLALAMAMLGKDISAPLALAAEGTGVIPPLVLFCIVMVYSVFGTMSGFANSDGPVVPRSARILLCFGTALLIIAFTIFFVNVRSAATGEMDQSFQKWTSDLFGISVFLLGLPYLGWIVWKRRERLLGKEEPAPAELAPGSDSA